jgi:hypothetical protein
MARETGEERTGLIGRLVRWRKSVSVAMVVCALPIAGGCFGHFPLTRAVYNFNNTVPSGILRNLVFWAFLIIPVYSIAATVDMLVLNLIEFWLPGRMDSTVSTVTEDGKKIVVTPTEDGREATLTVSEEDAVVLELRLTKVSDELLEIRDADGRLLGSARLNGSGMIELADALGQVVKTVPAEELAAL